MSDNVLAESPRLRRERQTIRAMIGLYCHDQHGGSRGLCEACAEINEYALARLTRCPYQADKPTCVNCLTHCYRPAMRQRVREVMRYAGPRMLWRHPILAIWHLIDGKLDRRRLITRKSTY